jgi:hypothetical protein
VPGNVHQLHVRVDIDEHDVPRFRPGALAPGRPPRRPAGEVPHDLCAGRAVRRPKKSLTGDNTERVDTRVLQVTYALDVGDKPIYLGQQLDVFIDVAEASPGQS